MDRKRSDEQKRKRKHVFPIQHFVEPHSASFWISFSYVLRWPLDRFGIRFGPLLGVLALSLGAPSKPRATPRPTTPHVVFPRMLARSPWPALIALSLVSLLLIPLGRSLNVLARGPLQAAALGVAVKPLEWGIYIAASLLTAMAVTTAGSIGFVGLVVPHLLRLVLGNDQRLILPACALAGGTLLTLADTLARTIIAPEQLPVGVITALLGVPSFLFLLYRSR